MSQRFTRRAFVASSIAVVAGAGRLSPARAQSAQPLKIVVGFPPGGGADMVGRAISEPMRASLGQTVIIDNRPGAGGRIAAEQLKNTPADGNTVLLTPASVLTLVPHIYKNPRYDGLKDFVPVTSIARLPIAMYVNNAVPADIRSADALARWLSADPKRLSYAIPGAGSTPHMAGLLFGRAAKLDWQAIPYQGGAPVITAVTAGDTVVGFGSIADGIEHVKAGRLRIFATTGAQRSSFLPAVPTLAEMGFGDVVVEDRHSMFVAKGTSAAAVLRLNAAARAALQTKETMEVLNRLALEPTGDTPEEFAAWVQADNARWASAAKTLGLSMD